MLPDEINAAPDSTLLAYILSEKNLEVSLQKFAQVASVKQSESVNRKVNTALIRKIHQDNMTSGPIVDFWSEYPELTPMSKDLLTLTYLNLDNFCAVLRPSYSVFSQMYFDYLDGKSVDTKLLQKEKIYYQDLATSIVLEDIVMNGTKEKIKFLSLINRDVNDILKYCLTHSVKRPNFPQYLKRIHQHFDLKNLNEEGLNNFKKILTATLAHNHEKHYKREYGKLMVGYSVIQDTVQKLELKNAHIYCQALHDLDYEFKTVLAIIYTVSGFTAKDILHHTHPCENDEERHMIAKVNSLIEKYFLEEISTEKKSKALKL